MATSGVDWKRPGMFMFDLGAVETSTGRQTFISWLANNNFGWIVLQCFDGNYPGYLRFQQYIPSWISDARMAGLNVGLWGVQHADPSGDAQRASDQINLWHPDFYIADAEDDYKTDSGGTRANSATFVNAFRSLQPSFKAALTSYGAGSGNNLLGDTTNANAWVFDYKSWYDAGFHFMPQAYYNQSADYRPVLCTRQAKMANWPLSKVHLVVGIYNGGYLSLSGSDYANTWLLETNSDVLGGDRACSPTTAYGFSVFCGGFDSVLTQQDIIDLGAATPTQQYGQLPNAMTTYGDMVWGR